MTKICPHCQCDFECRNDNVMECDCVNVILTKEAFHFISSRYSECLCVDCLLEINLMPALIPAV
ncbi:MAG: cysteine-rich CWC family protein [Bacteroidales bacterium]|nr:cysteine-rich CWC family protein [Bacteroidales bacterium]